VAGCVPLGLVPEVFALVFVLMTDPGCELDGMVWLSELLLLELPDSVPVPPWLA
jgi:hypothetical protein